VTHSSGTFVKSFFGLLIRLAVPVLILAIGGGAYYTLSQKTEEDKRPESRKRQIRTRVTELRVQDYSVAVTTQGIVQPHNEITLSGQVSGQITLMSPRFEVGAYFTEGEVLIELDDRDYVSSLRSAEASHLSAQSQAKLAELEYQRTAEGFEGTNLSVMTKAEVDQSAAAVARAKADVNSARAAVDQAKLDLERTKIRAPFNGRVREKMVGLGQSLNPGTPSAVIFAVDYAEVRLPISARDRKYLSLPELDGAESIPVELYDSIDPDTSPKWKAHIVRTEGTLDAGSLELFAVARIDDPFGLKSGNPPLRIGQPVTGSVLGAVLSDVVAIPRGAVRELDQIILIDKSDLTLSKIAIEQIWSDEEFIIVRSDVIQEDKFLATTHIVYAPEGATVEIIPEIDDMTEGRNRESDS
jgi:RND family efflux transporter MFP subunit